ncbi:hypothetical protein SKM57_08790 [Acinetobacter faecalis]|uniref:hypothetical protein n=1 Tax=Acinetobacter faecalis TaxID=2665161 RepID=UPI002A91E25E|nr:hypothetical protein [Acinetobacter faecalis]MDY6457140.1 hypothetical protein [Acinetobacter faecalis]MDY6468670.1 hypothetical protein [Acinetobacter faecalis]
MTGVTMKKHYPDLDHVSDVLDLVPSRQVRSVSRAMRVCNDTQASNVAKLCAVLEALI